LRDQRVTVCCTEPAAIRAMMRAGASLAQGSDIQSLRFLASTGGPLGPEAVLWGRDAFGLPIHDDWLQTETGAILIANFPSMDIRPGSMGRPLPGVDAAIVRDAVGGGIELVTEPDVDGEIAIRRGGPSMFRGYLYDDARYAESFAGDWYLTGDLARRDADGYFWFTGRADDVIDSAGHLVGPFEVESVLLEHAAIAEVGVIGKPAAGAAPIVKAFVVLKPGALPNEALERELLGFARVRLGTAFAPKELAFVPSLPRTRSGEVLRRLLKARELGLPEGDTSTLEARP